MVDIIIKTENNEVEVVEKNVLNKGLTIEIINEDGEDEYFVIQGNDVCVCESLDIDLNSKPSVIRVLNHIENAYGVEI